MVYDGWYEHFTEEELAPYRPPVAIADTGIVSDIEPGAEISEACTCPAAVLVFAAIGSAVIWTAIVGVVLWAADAWPF